MCEYIPAEKIVGNLWFIIDGPSIDVGDMRMNNLPHVEGAYWQCWHPETDSWEAMYPPTEGLALYMSPGSKVRCVTGTPPEHTKNTPPAKVGDKMRDLINVRN